MAKIKIPFKMNSYTAQLIVKQAREIERLRTLLAHGLVEAYDCKGCDLCKELKTIHQKVMHDEF